MTLQDAISRWAPAIDNPTSAYVQYVEHVTGLDGTSVLEQLSSQQLTGMMNAMQHFEGWKAGMTLQFNWPY